jgi:hypothetical protein
MKREVLTYNRLLCGCCPGHDQYPGDTYKNRRSKKARAKGKKAEHKLARTLRKRSMVQDYHECFGE